MQLSVTKKVQAVLDNRFRLLLKTGFKKVNYQESNGMRSFSLLEYSDAWGRFAKVVDDFMIVEGIDPLGIFTRKSNKEILSKIEEICNRVDEVTVENWETRFKTLSDYF